MTAALIGLGANLPPRADTIASAVASLARLSGTRVAGLSRLYETPAVGGPPDNPPFLNGAVLLHTRRRPRGLLAACLRIEALHGRVRRERDGPRTLDLDLLLYGDEEIDAPDLVVPHPRMAERAFVLVPAAEVAPDMVHPATGRTLAELRDALGPVPGVRPLTQPHAACCDHADEAADAS